MNAETMLRRMAAEPILTEKKIHRVILWAMAPRLLIGLTAYGLWKWLFLSRLYPEFRALGWLINDFAVGAIIYLTLRPLFVIMRMSDDEMDRIIPEEN